MFSPRVSLVSLSLFAFFAAGCGAEPSRLGEAASALPDDAASLWDAAAAMNLPRVDHAAVLLPDDRVAVFGGHPGDALTSFEIYDPALDTWTLGPSAMASSRYRAQAVPLLDGRVLVLPFAEIFDPTTGVISVASWSNFELLEEVERFNSSVVRLSDGKVLEVGGCTDYFQHHVAEVFDPAVEAWISIASTHEPRCASSATLLPCGEVLVVGGMQLNSNGIELGMATAERYDPSTGTWTPTSPLNLPRFAHSAALLPSGRVLVVGGAADMYAADGVTVVATTDQTAEIYDPSTDTWTLAAPPTARHRYGHSMTTLPDGRVLMIGGSYETGISDVEVYDEATNAWTSMSPLATRHKGGSTTLLATGEVLVAGGSAADPGGSPVYLATAERWTPEGSSAGSVDAVGCGPGAGGGGGGGAGSGGGGGAGTGGDAGTGGAGVGGGGAGVGGGGAGAGGAGGEGPGADPGEGDDGGCVCRAGGAVGAPQGGWTAALLGMLLLIRRRRSTAIRADR